ncbi:hypothetical protein WCT81_14430 [Pectobacterium versatile]
MAVEYLKEKHGCLPIGFMERDSNKVISMLKQIKAKYARVNILFKR